jgi:hypothetical protein
MLSGEYTNLKAIPPIIVGNHVVIEFGSIDFKTIPEKRQYRCRIIEIPPNPPSLSPRIRGGTRGGEIDSDWRKPTKATSFDYTFEEAGTYTFEVQAIDCDLNYSQPASLTLKVIPHPYLEELRQTREELEVAY